MIGNRFPIIENLVFPEWAISSKTGDHPTKVLLMDSSKAINTQQGLPFGGPFLFEIKDDRRTHV
jgi:hypothetical protein